MRTNKNNCEPAAVQSKEEKKNTQKFKEKNGSHKVSERIKYVGFGAKFHVANTLTCI